MSSQNSLHGEIKEQQQKTKDMSAKGRLSYFWYYYKVHTFVVIAVVAFIAMFIRQFRENKDYAFYAALINADISHIADNQWGDEFAEYAGIDTDKYRAYIDTSVVLSEAGSTQYSISSAEKLLVMMQTGIVDVIVADTETFENYAQNDFFVTMENALPKEVLEKYADCLYYTDAATFNKGDDDTFYTLDELDDPATFLIDHRNPATMEQPIPVGICLSKGNKIMDTGCYDYLSAVTYQGYPTEIVLGIPVTSVQLDTILKFLTFLEQ